MSSAETGTLDQRARALFAELLDRAARGQDPGPEQTAEALAIAGEDSGALWRAADSLDPVFKHLRPEMDGHQVAKLKRAARSYVTANAVVDASVGAQPTAREHRPSAKPRERRARSRSPGRLSDDDEDLARESGLLAVPGRGAAA